jgi:hypothetical protein
MLYLTLSVMLASLSCDIQRRVLNETKRVPEGIVGVKEALAPVFGFDSAAPQVASGIPNTLTGEVRR